MSYRIEVVKDNRKAGCQDTVCKKKGTKILKGELRLGTWVEMPAYNSAGWKWRHWGCTSGQILENIRKALSKDDGSADYQWELMDGFEECPPDVQEKFKAAIINGKIADEDFNGDPEFNVIGTKGIRSRASLKAATEPSDSPEKHEEVKPETPKVEKKRGRPMKDENSDEEGKAKPANKRAKKTKKEESEEEVIPAKKTRGKKATKKEESDEESEAEVMPEKRSRARRAVKKEEDAEEEVKPAKKSRAKGVKKEESEGPTDVPSIEEKNNTPVKEETSLQDTKPVKKQKAEKVIKAEQPDKAVKKEKSIPAANGDAKAAKSIKSARGKKETSAEVDLHDIPLKGEEEEEDELAADTKEKSEEVEKKPKKGKTKKAVTPASRPKSTRRQAAKPNQS